MASKPAALKGTVFSQNKGNMVSDMNGETVMLSVRNGKYYNLGDIGGIIWSLMEQPVTFEQLVDRLLEDYDVERGTCEAQVLAFVNRLLDEQLIDMHGESHVRTG